MSVLETIPGSGVYLSGCCKHGSVDSQDCCYLWCRLLWMYKLSSFATYLLLECSHLLTVNSYVAYAVIQKPEQQPVNMNPSAVTHWGPSPCCMPTLSAIFSSDSRFTPSNCPVSKSVASPPAPAPPFSSPFHVTHSRNTLPGECRYRLCSWWALAGFAVDLLVVKELQVFSRPTPEGTESKSDKRTGTLRGERKLLSVDQWLLSWD